jgi:hypothetical protein
VSTSDRQKFALDNGGHRVRIEANAGGGQLFDCIAHKVMCSLECDASRTD